MNRSSQLPTTSPSRGRQPGFTVMELLIVVGVMGVLLALLLPTVQKARASARRTACQNKLRQISLAIHGFETSHGAFPAGKSRRSHVEAYHELSWLRQILPYADQAAVWSLSERALKVEPFPYFNPPHEPLGMAIPLFACPDDSRVSVPQSASQLNGAFMMVVLISRSAMDPFGLWPTNRLLCLSRWQHAVEVKVFRTDLHQTISTSSLDDPELWTANRIQLAQCRCCRQGSMEAAQQTGTGCERKTAERT